jgi:hypothetical protein
LEGPTKVEEVIYGKERTQRQQSKKIPQQGARLGQYSPDICRWPSPKLKPWLSGFVFLSVLKKNQYALGKFVSEEVCFTTEAIDCGRMADSMSYDTSEPSCCNRVKEKGTKKEEKTTSEPNF